MITEKTLLETIQQILALAEGNGNTIDKSLLVELLGEKSLAKKDMQAVYDFLESKGIEIINTDQGDDDNVDRIINEFYDDEEQQLYGRNGDLDSYRVFLSQASQYSLLTKEQEYDLSMRWHRAMAVKELSPLLDKKQLSSASAEFINDAFSKDHSSEDLNDFFAPLADKSKEELSDILEDGTAARERLICSNIRLSVNFAAKMRGCGVAFMDLVQEGMLGIMKACDKYDPRLGYRFSTYATWWIRQQQSRAHTDQARVVRLPAHLYEKASKIRNAQAYLMDKYGREPSAEELADETGISSEKIRDIYQNTQDVLSTDFLVDTSDDRDYSAMLDFITDDSENTPEQTALENERDKALMEAVNSLGPRESDILILRYGLHGAPSLSLEEIGDLVGITKERVRQIETRGIKRLKQPKHKKTLREYTEYAV